MTEEDLRGRFEEYDRDGNGRIDRAEFGALVRALGVNMSDDRVYVAFSAIDTDGNGTIEYGEFTAWWKRR